MLALVFSYFFLRYKPPNYQLKNRLALHIESSNSLECLDEIKDLLHFLNDLEYRFLVVKQKYPHSKHHITPVNLKPELEYISKEILVLQMAMDSLIDKNVA